MLTLMNYQWVTVTDTVTDTVTATVTDYIKKWVPPQTVTIYV
jgi:hypothetical protein